MITIATIPTIMGIDAQNPAWVAVIPPDRRISGSQLLNPWLKRNAPKLITSTIWTIRIRSSSGKVFRLEAKVPAEGSAEL